MHLEQEQVAVSEEEVAEALDHPVEVGGTLGLISMMGMATFPAMVFILKILLVEKVYLEENMDKIFLVMIPNIIKKKAFHILLSELNLPMNSIKPCWIILKITIKIGLYTTIVQIM